jgi:mannose-1-phosphate guanylyltransferase
VVVVPVDERADVGSIVVDSDNNVVKFAEKDKSPLARHLNAGIYMLSRQIIQEIPPGLPISIERELFPAWIREARRVRAFVHAGKCVDIGTPERYQAAQVVLAATEAGVNARLDKEYQA